MMTLQEKLVDHQSYYPRVLSLGATWIYSAFIFLLQSCMSESILTSSSRMLNLLLKMHFCSMCPCLKVMCMCIAPYVHRARDHVEASSESLQPSPAAFPTHGLFAPAWTSTNGAYTASRPTTPCSCSGNCASHYGSQPYSRTPSCNCYSHIKASPHYFATHPRSSSNDLTSATGSSTNGTHLGSSTCRSHTSNSASNDGPHTTVGATTPELCTNTGAPTCSGACSWPIPPPSQPPVLSFCSMPRPFTASSKTPSAGHHPSPGVWAHAWSSSGSPSQWAATGWGLSAGDGGAGGLSGAGGTV